MKKFAVLMVATAAFFASSGAMAQGYVSLDAGNGHANIDCTGVSSCKNSSSAYKVTGGWGLGNGLAAELGYISFGKATADDSGLHLALRSEAFTLGAAYQAQMNADWGLNVRLGLASVKTTASFSGTVTGSDSEKSTQAYTGLGVNYTVSPAVKVQLSADFSRGKYSGQTASLRSIMAGLRFDF